MHRRPVGVIRPTVVVNVLEGEGDVANLEELFPTDALDPFADPLVLVGAFGGTASLEKIGGLLALETLPPTSRATPPFSESNKGMAGHMV